MISTDSIYAQRRLPELPHWWFRAGVISIVALFTFLAFAMPIQDLSAVLAGYSLGTTEYDVENYIGMAAVVVLAVVLERKLFRFPHNRSAQSSDRREHPIKSLTKLLVHLFLLFFLVNFGASSIAQPVVVIVYHVNGWTSEVLDGRSLFIKINILSFIFGSFLLYISHKPYLEVIDIIALSHQSPEENGPILELPPAL